MLRIGCQTYTWQMQGDKWRGGIEQIARSVRRAGYSGIETTLFVLGELYEKAEAFARLLSESKLTLSGLCLGLSYDELGGVDEKVEHGERMIAYLRHFPGAVLVLSAGSSHRSDKRDQRFEEMCEVYNRIGRAAAAAGIQAGVHPSSHSTSMITRKEDYDLLLRLTSAESVGLIPDTGHVAKAGYDLKRLLMRAEGRIVHLHLKDVDEGLRWTPLGTGIVDLNLVADFLNASGYEGWVILEEESAEAVGHAEELVRRNLELASRVLGRS